MFVGEVLRLCVADVFGPSVVCLVFDDEMRTSARVLVGVCLPPNCFHSTQTHQLHITYT